MGGRRKVCPHTFQTEHHLHSAATKTICSAAHHHRCGLLLPRIPRLCVRTASLYFARKWRGCRVRDARAALHTLSAPHLSRRLAVTWCVTCSVRYQNRISAVKNKLGIHYCLLQAVVKCSRLAIIANAGSELPPPPLCAATLTLLRQKACRFTHCSPHVLIVLCWHVWNAPLAALVTSPPNTLVPQPPCLSNAITGNRGLKY